MHIEPGSIDSGTEAQNERTLRNRKNQNNQNKS